MLTISKPLRASQTKTYHKEEFSNARENYYTEGDKVVGEWHGRLPSAGVFRGQSPRSTSRDSPTASIP